MGNLHVLFVSACMLIEEVCPCNTRQAFSRGFRGGVIVLSCSQKCLGIYCAQPPDIIPKFFGRDFQTRIVTANLASISFQFAVSLTALRFAICDGCV